MAGTKRTRAMAKAAPVSNEYVSDDGFIASDSDAPASKKSKVTATKAKATAKPATRTAGQDTFHELSTGKTPRRVNVSEFKGKQLVNIREYYEKDGELLPGKKGISLATEQFQELLKALPDIKKALGFGDGEGEEGTKKTGKDDAEPKEETLELTVEEYAEIMLKRNHPGYFSIRNRGKIYFLDEELQKDLAEDGEWEGQTSALLKEHDHMVKEYNEERDGPKEQYDAAVNGQYDSDPEDEAEADKSTPKTYTALMPKAKEVKGKAKKDGNDDDLVLTEKEKAQIRLQRKHPHTFAVQNRGKVYFIDDAVQEQFNEWEDGLGTFIKHYKKNNAVAEYDEKKDGPLRLYEAIIERDDDSEGEGDKKGDDEEEEDEGKPQRATPKSKAVPMAKTNKVARKATNKNDTMVMELSKKEKAAIILERNHPSTFPIVFKGKLYFIPVWLEDQWNESDGGVGEFLEENEDEVEEYDPEVDGPEDEYEPIGSWDDAWLDMYKK